MKNMNKKSILLLIAVAVLMVGTVGGTLAYLIAETKSVTNTFTPGTVGVEVEDKIENGAKTNVKITNTSTIPVYLRVAVVGNWCVGGEIVAQWDSSSITSATGYDSAKWTNVGIYFYYNDIVYPDDEPIYLFTSYTPTKPEDVPAEAELQMDIIAQVIQAEGKGATSAQDAFTK